MRKTAGSAACEDDALGDISKCRFNIDDFMNKAGPPICDKIDGEIVSISHKNNLFRQCLHCSLLLNLHLRPPNQFFVQRPG